MSQFGGGTTWKLHVQSETIWDNMVTTWRQFWDNFETTLQQLWQNFSTTLTVTVAGLGDVMCPDNRSLPRTQPGAVSYLRLIGLVFSFALSWTKELKGLSKNEGKGKSRISVWLFLSSSSHCLEPKKTRRRCENYNSRRKKVSYICWDVNLLFQLVSICTILQHKKKIVFIKIAKNSYLHIYDVIIFLFTLHPTFIRRWE